MFETKKEVENYFGTDAKAAAKSICGCEECFSNYKCNHTNRHNMMVRKLTSDETCPLEKYNITPDTRTFREKIEAGDLVQLNDYDLFAICACCEHIEGVKEVDGQFELVGYEKAFEEHCMDCPVHATRETMEELCAEASCS